MHVTGLLADDEAVSPVIGVILMVAITVILAAVVGAFALGLGGQQDSVPQASWTVSTPTDRKATIVHNGGDAVADENLVVKVGSTSAYEAGGSPDGDNDGILDAYDNSGSDDWTSTPISGGDQLTLMAASDQTGQVVRVIYRSPQSAETATLKRHTWEA